ncbi:Uncharacterised protein [Escherichia coli]|uniref:Uncharacterized protein n=1 Tax=Escherichia coli TaxID=562 RepID=A0A376W1X2_ECOLX|nr:Uncharacterised protein [Escherichia coli]
MHQYSLSQFALGGFYGPAQLPALAYPHNNSGRGSRLPPVNPESAPHLTGQYRYAPVTQPHEYDAHTPPLPPCHPRPDGQSSCLHRPQNPENGMPSLFRLTTAVSCAQAWPQPSHSRVSLSRPITYIPSRSSRPPAVNPHRHHISACRISSQADAPALLLQKSAPAQRSERRARPISTLACLT